MLVINYTTKEGFILISEELKNDITFELNLLTEDNIKETLSRVHRLTELYAKILEFPKLDEVAKESGVTNSIIDFSHQLTENLDKIFTFEAQNLNVK